MSTVPASALSSEFVPTTQDELQRFLRENFAGPKRALALAGGRTALEFCGSLSKPAVTVDMTRLDRIVDYPARDMTLTVEAGIRIDRLAESLRTEGQRLPIDVAQPSLATLGGAMATNTSGPRRFGYGTFRDYVIGLTAMTADGRVFHSGGRVVKNVAGYDLCKLLVGSLGTLAVVTQVTLKLKPLPASSVLAWIRFEDHIDRTAAVGELLTSKTRPVAIETLNPAAALLIANQARTGLPAGAALVVGFEGTTRETEWQTETLQQELAGRRPAELRVFKGDEAERLWTALTEFPAGADGGPAFRANLLPSQVAPFEELAAGLGLATLAHAGDGTVIGKLALPEGDRPSAAELVVPLDESARQSGGSIVWLQGQPRGEESLAPPETVSGAWAVMRKLKQAFDPADLLNPGRLFPR